MPILNMAQASLALQAGTTTPEDRKARGETCLGPAQATAAVTPAANL